MRTKSRMLLLLAALAAAPAPALAQAGPERMLLEAGLVGGNSVACPGQYVGIEGRAAGPISAYAMVENYRCVDLAGAASRLGASLRLGPARWPIRPAARAGIEYDGGDVSRTLGFSLTLGRRYGARIMVQRGLTTGSGPAIVLFQLGGYFSF